MTTITDRDPIIAHHQRPGRVIDSEYAEARRLAQEAWNRYNILVDAWEDGRATREQVTEAYEQATTLDDRATAIYVAHNHAPEIASAVTLELVSLGGVR
jgi:hypothetical protein